MLERVNAIKREWAAAVGSDDPDSLDDWPVDEIESLRLALERIQHFAAGNWGLSDAERIVCIAKECDAELSRRE